MNCMVSQPNKVALLEVTRPPEVAGLYIEVKYAYSPIRLELAYFAYCNTKRPGVFLNPIGWDASPSQGYSSIKFAVHITSLPCRRYLSGSSAEQFGR